MTSLSEMAVADDRTDKLINSIKRQRFKGNLSKAIKKTIDSLNISFLSAGLFAVEPEIVNAILRDRTFRLSKRPSDVARNSWDRLIRNHINDNNNGSSWRD